MTERGLPSADTSPACPFVAFEDDRDERADRPDHRHRCYAEAEPAPRAIAHQEAYCLSSAFPVCPVFQEWARREAARARSGDPTPAAAPPAPPPIAPMPGEPGGRPIDASSRTGGPAGDPSSRLDGPPDASGSDPDRRQDAADLPLEATPRRNPPRDWAAPPPWAGGPGGGPGGARGAGGQGGRGGPGPGAGAGAGGSGALGGVPGTAGPDGPTGGAPGGAPRPGGAPTGADLVGAAGGAAGAGAPAGAGQPARVPDFLSSRGEEGQGLAGSSADRIASGGSPGDARPRQGGAGDAPIDGPPRPPRDQEGPDGPASPPPGGPSPRSAGGPANVGGAGAGAGAGAMGAAGAAAAGRSEERSIGPDAGLAELLRRSDERAGTGTPGGALGASGDRMDPDERLAREREDERNAEAGAYARVVAAGPVAPGGRRPTVSSTRGRDTDREREPEARREPRRERVQGNDAPSWERSRRYEAYPTIKTRAGLPGMPRLSRVVLLAGVLALAAVAVFFLPALLGVGGDEPQATPSPSATSAAATATTSPTPEPEPTPQTYVIKEGDTLSKVAREFGLTLDQLLAANTETIEDPDEIAIGDEIIIPVPPPDEVGGEESAAPEETPEP